MKRLSKQQADQNLNIVIQCYKSMFGFDLSYMQVILDEQPHYRDGSVVQGKPKGWNAGSATDGGVIYINPDVESVFAFYGMPRNTDVNAFNIHMIAHELAHEIYARHASPGFKRQILNLARSSGFHTVYLDTVPKSKYAEELFCEYLAAVVAKFSNSGRKPDYAA